MHWSNRFVRPFAVQYQRSVYREKKMEALGSCLIDSTKQIHRGWTEILHSVLWWPKRPIYGHSPIVCASVRIRQIFITDDF